MIQIKTEKISCPLCSSDNFKKQYEIPDLRFHVSEQLFSVVSCRNCQHWYLNPRPVEEDLGKCYVEKYYQERDFNNPNQRARYERQASYFSEVTKGNFLDIGCAGGDFLSVMDKKGWKCFGMDYFKSPSTVSNKSISFQYGSIESLKYESNFFNAISAWGVFEHLLNPMNYFNEVFRILKPGGKFVMLVPNCRSLWSRFALKEDIPRHLQLFTPKSIRYCAEKSGLKIVKFNFKNHIYSRKASGIDGFRVRFLRAIGVPWGAINKKDHGLFVRGISKFGTLLGRLLIFSKVEEFFGLSGMVVVELEKRG